MFISTTVCAKWSHRWIVFISLFSCRAAHAWGLPLPCLYPYTYTLDAIWSITQKGRSGSSHLPLPCISIRQARKLNAVIQGCGCCMRVGMGLTWRSVWRDKMETFLQHYWTTPWSCLPCYMMSFCLIWWFCFTKNSLSNVLWVVWW